MNNTYNKKCQCNQCKHWRKSINNVKQREKTFYKGITYTLLWCTLILVSACKQPLNNPNIAFNEHCNKDYCIKEGQTKEQIRFN